MGGGRKKKKKAVSKTAQDRGQKKPTQPSNNGSKEFCPTDVQIFDCDPEQS